MNHPVSLLAKRYLWSKHREGLVSITALFAFLGIMLGVATLIIVLSVMDGFRAQLMDKILSFQGHVVIQCSKREGIKDYQSWVEKLSASETSIQRVMPVIERQSMLLSRGLAQGVMMHGVARQDLEARFPEGIEGSLETFDQGGCIVLGHKLAQKLFVDVGDRVTLVSPDGDSTGFGTLPRMRSLKVVGLFDAGMNTYDSGVAFIGLGEAQDFFKLPQAVTGIELTLKQPEKASDVVKNLKPLLGPGLYMVDWQQSNTAYMAALQVERNVMFLILSLIILIASFNIITGMTFLVKEKTKDIAFLRSIGAPRSMIAMIFYRISLVIGLNGIIWGVLLGVVITLNLEDIRQGIQSLTGAQLFSAELYYLSQLPAILSWGNVMDISVYTFILVVLAAFYPAWKASKIDPLKVLRHG